MLLHAASARMGLSDIAEQFRELDARRRHGGLSLTEAEHYHTLFERLSEALASSERHRRVDSRQFLRVRFKMDLVLRTGSGEVLAQCSDFGVGGCAIATTELFQLGDDLYLDGAMVAGQRHPLHGRAQVAWTRLPTASTAQSYGLRFCIESPKMRDQIDRLMYRVLDTFLHEPAEEIRLSH